MSKHKTAPPLFWRLRLVTATTSPSTATRPDSSVSVFMGTGRCLMGLPIKTEPVGLLGFVLCAAGGAEDFTRG